MDNENTIIFPQIIKEEIDKRVFALSYSINHRGKFVDTPLMLGQDI